MSNYPLPQTTEDHDSGPDITPEELPTTVGQNTVYTTSSAGSGDGTNRYTATKKNNHYSNGLYPITSWLPFYFLDVDGISYTKEQIKAAVIVGDVRKSLAKNTRVETLFGKSVLMGFKPMPESYEAQPYYFYRKDFINYAPLYFGEYELGYDFSIEGLEEHNEVDIKRKGYKATVSGSKSQIIVPKHNGQKYSTYLSNQYETEELEMNINVLDDEYNSQQKQNKTYHEFTVALVKMQMEYLRFQRSLANYYRDNLLAYYTATYPNHELEEFAYIDAVKTFNAVTRQGIVTALDGTAGYTFIKSRGAAHLTKNIKKGVTIFKNLSKARYLFAGGAGPFGILFMIGCDFVLNKAVDYIYKPEEPDINLELEAELKGYMTNVIGVIGQSHQNTVPMQYFDLFRKQAGALMGFRQEEGIHELGGNGKGKLIESIDSYADFLSLESEKYESGGYYELTTLLMNEWENKAAREDSGIDASVIATTRNYRNRLEKISEISLRVGQLEAKLLKLIEENESSWKKFKSNKRAKEGVADYARALGDYLAGNVSYIVEGAGFSASLLILSWYENHEQFVFMDDESYETQLESLEKGLDFLENLVLGTKQGRDKTEVEKIRVYLEMLGIDWISNDEIKKQGRNQEPINHTLNGEEFQIFQQIFELGHFARKGESQENYNKMINFNHNGGEVEVSINHISLYEKDLGSAIGNVRPDTVLFELELKNANEGNADPDMKEDAIDGDNDEDPKKFVPEELKDKTGVTDKPIGYKSRLPVWNIFWPGDGSEPYWHWSFLTQASPTRNVKQFWKKVKKFRRHENLILNDVPIRNKRKYTYDKNSHWVVIPPEENPGGPIKHNSGYYIMADELSRLAPLLLSNEVGVRENGKGSHKMLDFNVERILRYNGFNDFTSDARRNRPRDKENVYWVMRQGHEKLYIPYYIPEVDDKANELAETIDEQKTEKTELEGNLSDEKKKARLLSDLKIESIKYANTMDQFYSLKTVNRKMNVAKVFEITRKNPLSQDGLIKLATNEWEYFANSGLATVADATKFYSAIKTGGSELMKKMMTEKFLVSYKPTFSRRTVYQWVEHSSAPLGVLPFAYKVACDFILNSLVASANAQIFQTPTRHDGINEKRIKFGSIVLHAVQKAGEVVHAEMAVAREQFLDYIEAVDLSQDPAKIEALINEIRVQQKTIEGNLDSTSIFDESYVAKYLEIWLMENMEAYYDQTGKEEDESISLETWDKALGTVYDQNIRTLAYEIMKNKSLPFTTRTKLMKQLKANNIEGIEKVIMESSSWHLGLTNSPNVGFFEPTFDHNNNQMANQFFPYQNESSLVNTAANNLNDIALPLVKSDYDYDDKTGKKKSSYELVRRPLFYINQFQLLASQMGVLSANSMDFIPTNILFYPKNGSNWLRVKEEQEYLNSIILNPLKGVFDDRPLLMQGKRFSSLNELMETLEEMFNSQKKPEEWIDEIESDGNERLSFFKQIVSSNSGSFKEDALISYLAERKEKLRFHEGSREDHLDLVTSSDNDFWTQEFEKGDLTVELFTFPSHTFYDRNRKTLKVEKANIAVRLSFGAKRSSEGDSKKPAQKINEGTVTLYWEEDF